MSDGNGGVSALDLTGGQAGNAQYLLIRNKVSEHYPEI